MRETLFDHVSIPANQIFGLNETVGDVESAAIAYQAQLAGLFHTTSAQCPRFDLILLGMGPDGHVALLFPRHPLLGEKDLWVAAISDSPKPPSQRITFTLPLINAARHLLFIVTGGSKAEKVKAALTQPPSAATPASLVQLNSGNVEWFLDEDVASVLP